MVKPPGLEELAAYAREIGYTGFDAGKFRDYYEACGWIVGRAKPMKDWRAAVRNWRRNERAWNNRAELEDDPAVLDYARQAARIIRDERGYNIGRFWDKVRDAIGPDGLARVQALARKEAGKA